MGRNHSASEATDLFEHAENGLIINVSIGWVYKLLGCPLAHKLTLSELCLSHFQKVYHENSYLPADLN